MAIINEKDEQNPENSRTIDTDTGVYLKLDAHDIRDREYYFSLYDGDKIIEMISYCSWEIDEENKIMRNCHHVGKIFFLGTAIRINYLTLIRNIFSEHGRSFKSIERRGEYKEITKTDFKNGVEQQILTWEEQ
ncbi:MAG: hypothetical protein GY761_00010 [Hyphomicrobiales bacterium]|nr:hypothetical protein [Hyphomicrobiales bacterium]